MAYTVKTRGFERSALVMRGRETVAEVFTDREAADQHHNAALFAAAPDLLAALKLMMREYECLRFEQPERWPDAATAARAAIAKATNPEN